MDCRLSWTVVLSVLALGLAAICMMAGHASAWEIPEPWYVEEDFTLSNGTWYTQEPIYIENGTLWLVNATLYFSPRTFNLPLISVGVNGSLYATRSNISSWSYQGVILVYNDTHLDNTTIFGYTGRSYAHTPTIIHYRGRLVLDNVSHAQDRGWVTFLESHGDLTVRGCTITSVDSAIIWEPWLYGAPDPPAGHPALVVEDTSFSTDTMFFESAAIELRRGISFPGAAADAEDGSVKATVARCRIKEFYFALLVGNHSSPCDYPVSIEANYANSCAWGAKVVSTAYDMSLRGNKWRMATSAVWKGTTGIHIDIVGYNPVTVEGDIIDGGEYGLVVTSQSQQTSAEIMNSTVVGATIAVHALGARVNIWRSALEATYVDLRLENESTVLLYGCTLHKWSSELGHGGGTLVAYDTVDIEAVVWQEGTLATSGLVRLEARGAIYIPVVDAAAPGPTWMPRWYLTTHGLGDITEIWGYFLLDGLMYIVEPFDPWTGGAVTLVAIDDVSPDVTITSPSQGALLRGSAVVVEGGYREWGAGMGGVKLSLDQGPWVVAILAAGGLWCATFLDVPDGPHTIGIEAADRAGNAFRPDPLVFRTDATPPFIDVLSPGEVVGASPVLLAVQTERRSAAMVNGTPVQVSVEGRFELWTPLRAGPNAFFIEVVDEAGNVNRTMYIVLLDVEPPSLVVQSPRDGDWMASSVIRVAGRAEQGARVWVNGYPAARDGAWFSHDLTVTDWEFHIWVEAEDAVGNRARVELDVHVDTVPPELRVLSPANGSLINANRTVITGFVFDNSSVRLAVGGVGLGEALGSWSCLVALAEGANEVLVTAVDAAGNQAQRAITLVVDTVAPSASAELMLDGRKVPPSGPAALTRSGNATLVLDMGERCTVSATGLGTFQAGPGREWFPVPLQEGLNEVIVEVTDEALNSGLRERFLAERDTTPPLLRIDTPPSPWDVHQPFIRLWGLVEPGCTLTVNGARVHVGEGGEYDTNITLVTGKNELRIVARDAAGNEESVTLQVPYSGPQPEPAGDGASPGAQVLLPLALLIVLLALLWGRVRRTPRAGPPECGGANCKGAGDGITVQRRRGQV